MNIEVAAFYILLLGVFLGAVAWLWLLVAAFKTSALWGLALLLFPPCGLVFPFRHWPRAKRPLLLFLLAGLVIATPYGVNLYHNRFASLGPREKIVDGERHITLTGWDGTDYSILRQKPDTVVLQLANPDVDDRTLENLRGMTKLRELDLNGAGVTDEGLGVLAELPSIQELRLARVKITDDGFQKYLAHKESLRKLDLTGTQVHGKSKREWKKAQPGRDYVD
jgi:hypothetical protein